MKNHAKKPTLKPCPVDGCLELIWDTIPATTKPEPTEAQIVAAIAAFNDDGIELISFGLEGGKRITLRDGIIRALQASMEVGS